MMNGNEMDMALSFIPLLRGFVVPRVFSQNCLAGLSALLLSARAAGGILSMLMREMEFQICLQFTLPFLPRSDCFVCLFFILVAGNNYGEMDYRLWRHISVWSSLYLSHVLWLCRRCSWNLSLQNNLSARQWSHYFNILDIYDLLTFPVVQPSSWRHFRNALPEIPKEIYNPVILNNLLLRLL